LCGGGEVLILAETKFHSMNHFISLSTATAMTTRFRNNRESILKTEYQNQNLLPIAETFDKAAFEILIDKPEATALRIYYGMDENLKIHAIIVAVNQDNEDILPSSSLTATEEEDIIDSGIRCPELCPSPSPLNGEAI
jgi:hypothetical protein